jgi:hypothetical protein
VFSAVQTNCKAKNICANLQFCLVDRLTDVVEHFCRVLNMEELQCQKQACFHRMLVQLYADAVTREWVLLNLF